MECALYIHIPFCMQRCLYCNFFSKNASRQSFFLPYKKNPLLIDRILRDVLFFKKTYHIDFFKTVYIGGGTPSLLHAHDIAVLARTLALLQKQPIQEFTIEMNPEDVNYEYVQLCRQVGINRISLGVQSFDDRVFAAVCRRGSAKQNRVAITILQNEMPNAFSLDFIAGLPEQTLSGITADMHEAIRSGAKHISLYELDTEEVCESEMARRADFFSAASNILQKAGFMRYEVSNFAYADEYQSLHNKIYWKMQSYLGIGPGAVGTLLSSNYESALRITATRDICTWLSAKNPAKAYSFEFLSKNIVIEETMLMGFRLFEGIDRADFFSRFHFDIVHAILPTCRRWQKNGLLILTQTRIALTEKGIDFLNRFLLEASLDLEKFLLKKKLLT